MQRALLIVALAALCSPALAQRSRAQPTPAPAPAAAADRPAAPAAPDPQRTTATFGDWTLRCVRPEHGTPTCEVGQTLLEKGQAVAQTAIGRPRAGEPIRLTVLVPVNVSFAAQPRLVGNDSEAGAIPLTWRRCVPTGCFADTALTDEQLGHLRARTENGRVLFQDASGREVPLPFGPRGLAQALDALAKEG
jgi:invasion protein IalB